MKEKKPRIRKCFVCTKKIKKELNLCSECRANECEFLVYRCILMAPNSEISRKNLIKFMERYKDCNGKRRFAIRDIRKAIATLMKFSIVYSPKKMVLKSG
jgi:hypothetical protein